MGSNTTIATHKVSILIRHQSGGFFIHRCYKTEICYNKSMKNKWIYIGVGILLIMVVGTIIFIHFTAPEILTKTPLELITGRDIQDEVNEIDPILTESAGVTDDFIVSDALWQNAFRLNKTDGTPLRGTIGFSYLPIGTELRAPLDGYISEGRTNFPGEKVS